jgi:glycosyl transferase family 9 (putative heptosyltransferase)
LPQTAIATEIGFAVKEQLPEQNLFHDIKSFHDMKVISFSRTVSLDILYGEGLKTALILNAGQKYLLQDTYVRGLQDRYPCYHDHLRELSDPASYLRRDFDWMQGRDPMDWRDKRVLLSVHPNGGPGFGDELMAGCLPRYFKEVLGAQPFQVSSPIFAEIWAANPFVTGPPVFFPTTLDPLVGCGKEPPFFDWSLFVEGGDGMAGWGFSDTESTYDALFRFAGVDPSTVAPEFKRPVFLLRKTNIIERDAWLKQIGVRRYFVLQLTCQDKFRTFPLSLVEQILEVASVEAARIGATVFCVKNSAFSPEISALIKKTPHAVNLENQLPTVTHFAELIAGASLFIGPDSSGLHFAAAFETPALGLWGSFHPDLRVTYYKNQVHIYHDLGAKPSKITSLQPALASSPLMSITKEEISTAVRDLLDHRKANRSVDQVGARAIRAPVRGAREFRLRPAEDSVDRQAEPRQ